MPTPPPVQGTGLTAPSPVAPKTPGYGHMSKQMRDELISQPASPALGPDTCKRISKVNSYLAEVEAEVETEALASAIDEVQLDAAPAAGAQAPQANGLLGFAEMVTRMFFPMCAPKAA